jgi:catechol 2,3-dioxygenase-like lactoylglutathione lyase family enzyme
MTIEINGIAHVILTVSRFDLARAFYGKLLSEFGMKPVYDGEKFFYCVGARTAIGIEPCDPALAGEAVSHSLARGAPKPGLPAVFS